MGDEAYAAARSAWSGKAAASRNAHLTAEERAAIGSVAKMRKRRFWPVGNPVLSNRSRSSSLVKIELCNRALGGDVVGNARVPLLASA
jgi:hypothetical protein